MSLKSPTRLIRICALVLCGTWNISAWGADKPVLWPHCLVEADELPERSLKEAVDAFNEQSKHSPVGRRQRPVTVEETLAAIDKTLKSGFVSKLPPRRC